MLGIRIWEPADGYYSILLGFIFNTRIVFFYRIFFTMIIYFVDVAVQLITMVYYVQKDMMIVQELLMNRCVDMVHVLIDSVHNQIWQVFVKSFKECICNMN